MTERFYNDPYNGSASTIGEQIIEEAYWRKAIVDAARDQYFQPLAEVRDMPKNSGKVMKANVYIPILDVRNVSDEGLDAVGNSLDATLYYVFLNGELVPDSILTAGNLAGYATTAAAMTDVDAAVTATRITQTIADSYSVTLGTANLYGSSRDVGVITNRLPVLAEGAARVNRIGATRVVVEGTMEQFGFFNEYTEESMQFDTDSELNQHITTELLGAASEITEDTLQLDLLSSAGVVRYTGAATSKATLGAGTNEDVITYNDFIRLSIALDLNRTPKNTKVLTGSRMIDTKTINAARIMYVGPEMESTLDALVDNHNNKAMIDVRHYEGQTTTLNGEIGTIHNFRIVVNPEMQNYPGQGADASAHLADYYTSDPVDAAGATTEYFDVQPMLVVGDDSFSTIGFMSDGKKKNTKFTINHMRPGPDSVTRENPYGNMGLMSIRWWYGFLLKRSERIALILTVAQY